MVSSVMFSSQTDEWETPKWLFDELDAEFSFSLDVCASKENHKCEKYYDMETDGLKQDWSHDVCWMNPPYSDIATWIKKAYEEAMKGAVVVCLIPSRTDTRWFHEYIWDREWNAPYRGVEIRFIKGRLKFGGAKNSAPFPSMVVVFDGGLM